MRLELEAAEAKILLDLLESADRDRLHQIHHTDSRDYRERLRDEDALIEKIRDKLRDARMHSEDMIDESVEESFPASDPPARSSLRPH